MAEEQNLEGDEGTRKLQLDLSLINGAGTKAMTDLNSQIDKFTKTIETLPHQLKAATESFSKEVQQLTKAAEILKSPSQYSGSQNQLFGVKGEHGQLRDWRGRFIKGPQPQVAPQAEAAGITNENAQIAQEEAKNAQEEINSAGGSSGASGGVPEGPKSYARHIAEMHWRHPLGLLHARRFLGSSVSGNLHTFAHGSAAMADWVTSLQKRQMQAEEKGESPNFNPLQQWAVGQNSEQMGAWAKKAKIAALGLGTASGMLGFEGIKRSLGEFGHPTNWNMIGASLGANRGNGPIAGVPILGPLLSSASGVGFEQTAEVLGNALMHPGLNLMQSERIRTALNQSGFGGHLGQEISNKALIPGFQQYGMNPEAFVQGFERTLRNNPESINKLVESLGDLGKQAEKTHMTVTQTVQDLAEVNSQFEEAGGAPGQGAAWASLFHTQTGMKASEGLKALTSPISTAMIGQMTGAPAFAQRSLTPAIQQMGLYRSVNMLRSTIKEPSAMEKFESPENYLIGAITHYMGVSPSEAAKLLHVSQFGEKAMPLQSKAEMMLEHLNQKNVTNQDVQRYIGGHNVLHRTGSAWSSIQSTLKSEGGFGTNLGIGSAIGSLLPGGGMSRGRLPAGTQVIHYNNNTDEAEVRLPNGHTEKIHIPKSELHVAMGGSIYSKGLQGLEKEASKSGVFGNELGKVMSELHHITGHEATKRRLEAFRSDINKKIGDAGSKPKLEIELLEKGKKSSKLGNAQLYEPERFAAEVQSRAGGAATNSLYASPYGLSPLSGGNAEIPGE